MKKATLLFLSVALILFSCGCGKSTTEAVESSTEQTALTTEETTKVQNTDEETTTEAESSAANDSQGDSSAVDASWFDDAVFVGDSVTLKLSYYCDSHPEALGNAQFFCAGSLGYTNALWELDRENAVHPYYKGENRLTETCVEATGASKAFIMLGMNDIGVYGIDGAMDSAKELVGKICSNSPDASIYIQSVTPITYGKEGEKLNNQNIRSFNSELEAYCKQSGYKYLDVYSVLSDDDGYLPSEYCSDSEAMGIHFTDKACEIWSDYLKENVLKGN